MTSVNLESTNRLLKTIIGLLVRKRDQETLTLRQQIEVLDGFAMKPFEIAEILGRSSTYVNKELSGIRKHLKHKDNANGKKANRK